MMARGWMGAKMVAIAALLLAPSFAGCDLSHSTRRSARQDDLSDLPIVELPADARTAPMGGVLAVVISGDGGWGYASRAIAEQFAARGLPVIGLDARRYLDHRRTPDESAADMRRILEHYLAAWRRDSVLILGYSRGADLAPFMIARLPASLRERVRLIALVGVAPWANFEFHPIDLLVAVHRPDDLPVTPELARLDGVPLLCVYGRDDHDSLCPSLDTTRVHVVGWPGGHRMGSGVGKPMAELVLNELTRAKSSENGN